VIWVLRNTCCPVGRARTIVPGEAGPTGISLVEGGRGAGTKIIIVVVIGAHLGGGGRVLL
jgi:hypothetical protein